MRDEHSHFPFVLSRLQAAGFPLFGLMFAHNPVRSRKRDLRGKEMALTYLTHHGYLIHFVADTPPEWNYFGNLTGILARHLTHQTEMI